MVIMTFRTVEIKDVKRNLGQVVKVFRKNKNLSQSELAEILDVSRTTIQNVELGRNFTIDTILKVLKEFEMLEDLNSAIDNKNSQILNSKSLY